MVQLVAAGDVDGRPMLSLGSNTDTSLDLLPVALERRAGRGAPVFTIAELHPDMPFMYNRALVEPAVLSLLVNQVRDPVHAAQPLGGRHRLAIGLHTSALLRDGGTLQIGISSLGDAIVYASACARRESCISRVVAALGTDPGLVGRIGGLGRFEQGIYGCSRCSSTASCT
jgi:hypothetical protein